MIKHWILDGHTPVETDLMTWGKWFEGDDRKVAYDEVGDTGHVSTVFIGIDDQLFETMIFGGLMDQFQYRYDTWDDAVRGHHMAVAALKALEETT